MDSLQFATTKKNYLYKTLQALDFINSYIALLIIRQRFKLIALSKYLLYMSSYNFLI